VNDEQEFGFYNTIIPWDLTLAYSYVQYRNWKSCFYWFINDFDTDLTPNGALVLRQDDFVNKALRSLEYDWIEIYLVGIWFNWNPVWAKCFLGIFFYLGIESVDS
jgi:hypothetical protein